MAEYEPALIVKSLTNLMFFISIYYKGHSVKIPKHSFIKLFK